MSVVFWLLFVIFLIVWITVRWNIDPFLIAAFRKSASHANDSNFLVVAKFSNMDTATALKTYGRYPHHGTYRLGKSAALIVDPGIDTTQNSLCR